MAIRSPGVTEQRSLLSYAGRFVLPLALLVGAVAAWQVSERLAATETRIESAAAIEHVETPMTSIRRMPEVATSSLDNERIGRALAALPTEPGGLSCAAVHVDGEPVLSVRPDQSLIGGYAQLLFTGYAALDVLGPTYTFETRLMAENLPNDDGRISGGAYLVGSGDPVLMTQRYALRFRPALVTRTAVEQLAASAAERNVLQIDGGIIGVERRYDTLRSLPGWPDRFATEGLVGPLSALQIDDGFRGRDPDNLALAVPADFPATHAAETFAGLLEASGVEVNGTHRTLGDEQELPSLVPIASISSAPMSDIVFQTLAINDATAAELLLKELGVATTSQGTTQAGGQAVQRALGELGVDVPVAFRDGSGLDPLGGASCNQLVAAADAVANDHPLLGALPAYNLPGVFDGRLRDVEVSSDLRVVGGTVGESSSLVGRTVDQGRRVTIASIVNRPGGPSESDLAYQQSLVEVVDALRSSAQLEAIEVDGS